MDRFQFYNTTFGSVFDLAFDIMRRCWGRFLLCAVWPAIVSAAIFASMIIMLVTNAEQITAGNEALAQSVGLMMTGFAFVGQPICNLLFMLTSAACLYVIQQAVRGKQLSSRQAYKMVFKRFGTVVWTQFLASFWLFFWGLAILPVSAILDDLVTSDAMARMSVLYKGYRKRSLSIILVAIVLMYTLMQFVTNVSQVAMNDQIWAAILLVVYVMQVVIAFMMIVSILPLVMASWYYSLLAIKDGFDIDHRLSQLEQARGLAA
ncbi:MAG: hypothetical protein ACYC1M_04335 [Armatimonadota bacterium]